MDATKAEAKAKTARAKAKTARANAIEFALSLPEAWSDSPWGEGDLVIKVRKKIFMFAGSNEPDDKHSLGISVKLPVSRDEALSMPDANPTGYGLGRSGWVNLDLAQGPEDADLIRDWIEESYRTVAPKTLAARIE